MFAGPFLQKKKTDIGMGRWLLADASWMKLEALCLGFADPCVHLGGGFPLRQGRNLKIKPIIELQN